LGWLPTKLFLSTLARGWIVELNEVSKKAEMIFRFFKGLADDGNIEVFADYFGNITEWYAFIGNSMVSRSSGTFLERQPVESSYVDTVNGRPPVEPITNVR
jgi:hypothetical protein